MTTRSVRAERLVRPRRTETEDGVATPLCARQAKERVDPMMAHATNVWLIAAAWMLLAFVASVVSIRTGISVALIEIGMGVIGGNFLGLQTSEWVNFLATFGAVLLTFLAGAEIEPDSLRVHLKAALVIGFVSFLAPFLGAWGFAYWVTGWTYQGALICGIALSTTSVAVVYAVMVETGLSRTSLGKMILAACFVSLPAVVTSAGLILALLAVKLAAKSIGVWPLARVFKLPTREANYTTLMMATGLTFGTISALFGLEHDLIDRTQYTVLVTVVIGSAVVPTLIAQAFFQPAVREQSPAVEEAGALALSAGHGRESM